jgi:hypothetical protein
LRHSAALQSLSGILAPGGPTPTPPSEAEWPALIELAARHRLLPALWSASRDRGLLNPLAPEARVAIEARLEHGMTHPTLLLQSAYDENRSHLGELLAAWATISAELARAGIVAVPLKGLHANLEGWWRDPAARAMVDLDLLVPSAQAAAADELLHRIGFVATEVNDWADHHLPQLWLDGTSVCVELHTALTAARWQDVLPAADVLRGGRTRMSTTHAVTHTIAHAQLRHEAYRLGVLPFVSLLDTAAVAGGKRRDEIDWDEVRLRFSRVGADRALDGHLELARSLLGAAVPAPRARRRARMHAAVCRHDAELAILTRLRACRVYGSRAFAAERMRRLYGPGNLWAHRWRHIRARRLWRHLLRDRPP